MNIKNCSTIFKTCFEVFTTITQQFYLHKKYFKYISLLTRQFLTYHRRNKSPLSKQRLLDINYNNTGKDVHKQ